MEEPRQVPYLQMPHVMAEENLRQGFMVSHQTSGGIWRSIQLCQTPQLLDWFNDPKHGLDRLTWREAWRMARFTHTSSLKTTGVAEMTHPKSRFRTWEDLVGSTIYISEPKVSVQALEYIDAEMTMLAQRGEPYPKKELIASWWRVGKWLRKWLGNKKFDKYFTDKDQNVCSGSYAERVILGCGQHNTPDNQMIMALLKKHHITALSPAFLTWCMPEVFKPRGLFKITDELK